MERNYQPTEEQIQSRKERRELLKVLSKALKPSVENGTFGTTNAALVDFYSKQGHRNLKTFRQWKKEGYSIKKGMTALTLWGEQREAYRQDEDKSEYKYFPVAYVFSEIQVEKRKWNNTRPERENLSDYVVTSPAPMKQDVTPVTQPQSFEPVTDDLPF